VLEFGASGYFEVMHYEMNLDDGSINFVLNAVDPAVFGWDVSEEGQAQGLPTPDVADDIAAPATFTAAPEGVQSSAGTFAAGIGCAWSLPAYPSLVPRLEWALHGTINWVVIIPDPKAANYQITGLAEGTAYDLRLAFFSPSGQIGTYATQNNITAEASTMSPAAPASLTVTNLTGGNAQISFTAASSIDLFQTVILRGATIIATFYTTPGQVVTFVNASGAGTFNWSARSINVSLVPNITDLGPVSQTIT
jgi:hypothetical protein